MLTTFYPAENILWHFLAVDLMLDFVEVGFVLCSSLAVVLSHGVGTGNEVVSQVGGFYLQCG